MRDFSYNLLSDSKRVTFHTKIRSKSDDSFSLIYFYPHKVP